jgi:hypothetical protein
MLRRLFYDENDERYNPLMYPFFIATLAYGFGFALFSGTSGVESSSLYMAMNDLQTWMPQIWGMIALGVMVMNIFTLLFRRISLAGTTAFFGCLVWLFALFVYLLGADWLIAISVTLPNFLFWVWYYVDIGLNN